jgi:hypothetical protein
MSKTPEHKAWRQILARCGSPGASGYENYGGRGIRVCAEWAGSFEAFISDMGLRPSADYSIERENTNGNYEPGNCKWATKSEQARNTRRSRTWIVLGVAYETAKAAASGTGLGQTTIVRRCNEKREGYSFIKKYEVRQ